MRLAADHPDRLHSGLVFRDDTLADNPATHVLVVGVGAYQSTRFKTPLTTTTVSARAVADWFMGEAPGFHNDERPLGSVAVLLSEPVAPGGAPLSTYGGGPVPRASFADARAAVRAWVTRINSHKDNLALFYVASHGESFLSRTAFLLDDFGQDPLDATAGMSEVEQFVSALENAKPVSQLLLFDCCRTPTDMTLPWNEVLGSKLIALTRQPDDHGEPRKQWVIAATSLGEVAIGRASRTTLFAHALISALNGVASDPADEGWPVRPGMLVDRIDRLLSLHRLPDEKAQTPAGRLAGSFDITFPGEPAQVPVYVSLEDPAFWPDSSLTVTAPPGNNAVFAAAAGEPPFRLLTFPQATEIQISAARDGQELGSARTRTRPPAIFLEIKKVQVQTTAVIGQIGDGRSLAAAARLVLNVDGPANLSAGGVALVVRTDDPGKNPKEIAVAIGGKTPVDIRPGEYTITLRTPDGRSQTQDATAAQNEILEVTFTMPRSPHEWLEMAAATGATPLHPATDAAESALEGFHPSSPAGTAVASIIAGSVDMNLGESPSAEAGTATFVQNDDGQLIRLGFDLPNLTRFEAHDNGPRSRPLFTAIQLQARRELVVVPSLGTGAADTAGGWQPYILIDRASPPEKSLSTVVVEDRVWTGLLGFLALRDFEASSKLLAGELANAAVVAMQEKLGNPLAALAGALIAVSTTAPDLERRWDPWLRNIATWFPGIPDGPIILGRRLLMRARSSAEIEEARRCFLQGFARGAPIYSLSADWLARGLESLPGDDGELETARHAARKLANRIDSAQAFTVIRVSP